MTTRSRVARPRLLAAALTATAALAAAGTADAATLHMDGDTLVYTATPGVSNNWTTIDAGPDAGTFRLIDGSDHLQAQAGCTLPDPSDDTAVVCPIPARLRIELGDGDDRNMFMEQAPAFPVEVDGQDGNDSLIANNDADSHVTLDGGAGDDFLRGMKFNDVLLGGAGKDQLEGNGGDDELRGGDGDDKLEPDTYPDVIGNDIVDGGPGYDSVNDWGSTTKDPAFAISVSMDGVANDGRPGGEADNVMNVERVDAIEPGHYVFADTDDSIDLPDFGTSTLEGRGGNDTLTGGDGVETIDGGPGADRLEGGYNHDKITGGPGKDTIYGDETSQRCGFLDNCVVVPYGNDVIDARDGEADNIDCGVGDDTLYADKVDTIAANCEHVQYADAPGDGGNGGNPGDGGTTVTPKPPVAATCQVPKKLKGLTYASAKAKLRKAHCTTLKTKKVKSRTVRKGRVVSAVRKGRVVTVSVSRGRR